MSTLTLSFQSGVQIIIVSILALFLGSTLEYIFSGSKDIWGWAQLFITGFTYNLIRTYYHGLPHAWLPFASFCFNTQPSLIGKLKRNLRL